MALHVEEALQLQVSSFNKRTCLRDRALVQPAHSVSSIMLPKV